MNIPIFENFVEDVTLFFSLLQIPFHSPAQNNLDLDRAQLLEKHRLDIPCEDIFLIANKSKAYLFIGAKCTYSFVKETPASIHACINDVILKAGDLSWTGKNIIVVMEQLGLSDEFCDFFELGM